LGDLYPKLSAFAKVIDLEHPDLGDVFDGAISDGTEFVNYECCHLMMLAQQAVKQGLEDSKIVQSLWKLSDGLPKEVTRKIDSPLVNRLNVRFLKNAEDRQAVRSSKRMQKIDLKSLCKKGSEVWNAQPCDFSKFIRFDMAYQEELSRIEKKAKRYFDLGCTDLHSEIMKTVDAF